MFLKKYNETGSIVRRVGSGRPSKVTAKIKQIVEEQMRADDETMAYQLHRLLNEKGYSIFLRTILRCWTALGWMFHGRTYCQLIRKANKAELLTWAQQHFHPLTMPSGEMNVQSKWRVTDDSLVESVVKPLVQNQSRINFAWPE